MAVFFDDSLPILVRVIVEELGNAALENGVALRDAIGQLAFFCAESLPEDTVGRISERLREALSQYGRQDRILAGLGDFGVSNILADPLVMSLESSGHRVRLLDRRLVGLDWLRTPSVNSKPPLRFVFASLKGGVGRTTALTIAAAHFASLGLRVLAVDLDLEAPGLGSVLLDEKTLPEFGMIDALAEMTLRELGPEIFGDLIGSSNLSDGLGKIDVIPAFGRRSIANPGDVLAKISRAYTESIQSNGSVASILDKVNKVVDFFSDPELYDMILIDARAGLHETTAAAVIGLGAEVLFFGLDDPQTFQGYSALFSHMARLLPQDLSSSDWASRITMVQGKAPVDIAERAEFAEKCSALFISTGLRSLERTKADVMLPAEPFYDVPWDEHAETLPIAEADESVDVIAILYDQRFQRFEPRVAHDLLSHQIYRTSYQQFLTLLTEALPNSKRHVTR